MITPSIGALWKLIKPFPLQERKETEEPQACPAFLAGKGQWETLGLEDPRECQDSQGHQVSLVQSSLAKRETEVHQAQEEIQVEGLLLKKIKE